MMWRLFIVVCMCITIAYGQISTTSSPGTPINSGGSFIPMQPHAPNAIHHVGISYNLLKGNPDGEYWSTGGEDPGVSLTRKVFTISPGDNPPEVILEHHDGCQYSHGYSLFHSTKTYQDKLYLNVQTSGAADKILRPYGFTLSSGYQAVAQQTSHHHYVFQDVSAYCKIGHVRHSMHLAASDHYPVTREFATDICSLPVAYDKTAYMQFIENWGTHIMTEVTIGKATTNRFLGQLRNLFNFVMFNVTDEISMGGPLFGYKESYVIDLDSYKYKHEYKYIVGVLEDTLAIGDQYYNDVIAKTLQTVDMALDAKYWLYMQYYVQQDLCKADASTHLSAWQTNIVRALGEYPAFKGAISPLDTPLAMPVTWPLGTYTLPKPMSRCHIGFIEGSLNMPQKAHSGHPTGLYLDGQFASNHYKINYCTKEDPQPSQFDIYWPKGDYCIQKYDAMCPYDFKLGKIKFRFPGPTTKSGIAPFIETNSAESSTTLHFCCRNDTVYTHKIFLPSDSPFYLLRFQHGCQQVAGMAATDQTLTFYNDVTTSGSLHQTLLSYSYPYVETAGHTAYGDAQYKLHFCFYTPTSK